MKTVTVLLASIARTAVGWKNPNKFFHNDKQAIKNKVAFHRKKDRRK